VEQRSFSGDTEITGSVSTPWKSDATATEGKGEASYAAVATGSGTSERFYGIVDRYMSIRGW
jgi:hypothetical protein